MVGSTTTLFLVHHIFTGRTPLRWSSQRKAQACHTTGEMPQTAMTTGRVLCGRFLEFCFYLGVALIQPNMTKVFRKLIVHRWKHWPGGAGMVERMTNCAH